MANANHLAILGQGIEKWNEWRTKNVDSITGTITHDKREALGWKMIDGRLAKIDLSSADLAGWPLDGADLSFTDLSDADLRGSVDRS